MKKELQNKDKGLGFLRHWKVMTMTLLLLTFSIGQMWGAATNIATSLFIQTYAEKTGSSAPDNSALTSDFPSYLTYSLSSAANIAGNVSTITSPHDFSSMSSTAKLYHLKMGSSNTITLTEVSNVKSITLYGAATNANRVVRATFKTAVGDVAANAYVNGDTWAQEYNQSSTTTVTAHKINISSVTGYSASDAYTIELKSTSGGDYHIYGIYIEAGSGSGCSEPAAPTISGTASYNEGETITLTASHEGSNHSATTTYQWFKGATFATATSVQAAATGAAGYTFTKSAALSDAGTYWCEAANSTCKSHNVDGKAVTVNAAAVCPDGISISGTAAYTEGETIELTAALTKGNGTISYQWYKGSIAVGNEVGTGATFTKATCTTGDAGNYFCVATKDACSDEESSAFAVTVDPAPATGTISDLVEISDDYVYTPTEGLESNTLYEGNRFISIGDGNPYTSGEGIRIKENRALAFKVANNAKVKVTFVKNGSIQMQLGTATSGDARLAYGSSTTSPKEFDVITTGGVVYLTASNQLNMSKLEIFYPHTVTYALGDGTGTLPTEGAHYNGDKFDLHDGETNISAPEGKEFAGWNDGTSTFAGGVQYTMGATAVTLTAQWATPLPEPTITFSNGAYTIGGDALNLTSLFSSNSDGAVTYTVKSAGTTGAAIDGTSFTATTAGSATVTASQAATASYKAKSVDATITVSAPSEVDGVKLVEAGALTGNFRTTASLSSTAHTVAGIAYPKYIGLSARTSWSSQPSGPDNYLLQYTLTKKTNKFYFYAYNTNGGVQNVKVYVKEEGENCTTTNVPVSANSGELVSCDVNVSKNAEVCISVSATSLHICQVVVVESGEDQLVAPTVNYNINFNKGRLTAKSGTAKTYEGITYCNNADYKIDNSTYLKLTTRGTHYISFEIPAGQTRKLQVTTGGSAYNVSKTLGDNTTTTKTGNQDFNLGAGIWYINPQGSDVTVTNLKFVAADAAITVAFNSNGGSDVASQALFAGDVVTEPSPAPTKSGYRFVGWQKSGADYDFSTALVAGDAPGFTLDAVWQEVVVVTFDPNNGEDTFTKTADKGAVLAVGDRPSDPTYVGYDFLGWTRNAAAEPIVYVDLASETFSAAATLTAVWEVAQTDASLSALSYNGNAIDVSSAVDVSGVQTYTVHLQWGSTINAALISVTKSADPATMTPITYDSENKRASFMVTSGNGSVSINYAIQFVIDPKRGTSIVKAVISGGNQTAGFDATGIYGDKGYANTRNDKKVDTGGKFVGVKLLAGKTFAAGDKLFVVTSTDADRGYIEIYEEAAGTNLIKATGVRDASEGIEVAELAGYSEFYIVRKESEGDQAWNGTVNYVEVTREMAPAIKSFKFGDDAATINEGAKTITIEVPFSTDVTALTPTVEAYGNNGATYTPSGATDFTSPVDYVVKDAYSEFSTTYAVTVTKAAASTNADLASLAVAGYSLDFDPATTSYNIVLDYGTTVLPAITYEVADQVTPATAVKVEGGVNGATTITVTPQAGAGYEKVYTINFSVSTTPKFVIYDGSTMSDYAESGSDVSTGFAWTVVGGNHSAKNINITLNGKTYTKSQNIFGSATKGPNEGNTRYITITIPEGYLAKFYLAGATNSDESLRSSYISKEITGTLDESIAYVSADQYAGAAMRSNLQLPGTYYYCCDASIRLYELSVQLYPIDYSRDVTAGRYGTICLPNGGVMVGAALFEVAYHDATLEKIFFDEILNGEMIAGRPYIFLPNNGVSELGVFYTDAADAPAGNYHGLYGSYTQEVLAQEAGNYILYNNQYMYVGASSSNVSVGANRAYFKIGVEGGIPTNAVAPLPGRRRVSMSAVRETPTGLENGELINGENGVQKVLINGELFILRGEKMYDATGRLVK